MVLVDCDPDGMNIVRCYRDGSHGSGGLQSLKIHWLGIRTSQTGMPSAVVPGLTSLPAIAYHEGVSRSTPSQQRDDRATAARSSVQFHPRGTSSPSSSSQSSRISSTTSREPITQLSNRDRKVAVGMLIRLSDTDSVDGGQAELMQELRALLMLGVKAEIQWLDEAGSLVEWLDGEMSAFLRAA